MNWRFRATVSRMTRFDHIMIALVDFLAIKSWTDLLAKHIILTGCWCMMVFTLEYLLMPIEVRQTPIELLPMLAIGTVVINGLVFASATHLARLQRALTELALTDALTGLNNRRAFLEQAAALQQSEDPGYLLLIDADHFKRINDTYGHNVGDECLRAIAKHLRQVLGPNAPLGRLGGEEFGAILTPEAMAQLDGITEKLTQKILAKVPSPPPPAEVSVTLSIGMTRLARQQPLEDQLHQADVALYAAKRQGRARLVRWKPTLEAVA